VRLARTGRPAAHVTKGNAVGNSTEEKHNVAGHSVAGLSACGSAAQAGHSVAGELRTLQKHDRRYVVSCVALELLAPCNSISLGCATLRLYGLNGIGSGVWVEFM